MLPRQLEDGSEVLELRFVYRLWLRLEIRPEDEEADEPQAERFDARKVLGDLARVELRPHANEFARGPVVDAEEKFVVGHTGLVGPLRNRVGTGLLQRRCDRLLTRR